MPLILINFKSFISAIFFVSRLRPKIVHWTILVASANSQRDYPVDDFLKPQGYKAVKHHKGKYQVKLTSFAISTKNDEFFLY